MLSLPQVLAAQQQGSGQSEPAAVGTETRAWMELQGNGSAASPVARPMPGDIAEHIYKRHSDSFTHPIPEEMSRESFTGGNGGGK
jgi:hypothetical protein